VPTGRRGLGQLGGLLRRLHELSKLATRPAS
jgi:hypothetical protein